MAVCSKCGAESEPGNVGALRHKRGCPWQSERERIKELEEALRLARHEINRVLDRPGG